MATFLYYLSDRGKGVKIADLRAAGVGYAIDEQFTARQCLCGPDHNSGAIVSASDQRVGYYPDQQEWRRIHGVEAWVGMYREDRPTPGELARAEQLDGVWIRLDDGQAWLAPKARRWEEFDGGCYPLCNLPQRLALDVDGQWRVGAVKSRYEQLWRWACAYEQAFAEAVQRQPEGGVVRFQFDQINELAVAALQANYRVAAIELDMLGVYDLQARERIIDALLDNATWRDWLKKKLAAADHSGGSSCSGPDPSSAGRADDTAQPSPSCAPTPPACTLTQRP